MLKIGVSATLAANEALAERKRLGKPILPLAFGQANLPVHPMLREALAAAAGQGAYGPVAGIAELREAIADYWNRHGLPTHADQVIVGPGSKPLLYNLMLAIGGDIAIPVPSWVSYAVQARMVGGQPVLVPTLPGQGGVPDPDRLILAVNHARRLGRDVHSVLLTLPDNPTGTLAKPETVRRLCQAARELNLVIISDEIYRDLVFDPAAELVSPASLAPERAIVTGGLSKNLALGGWRLGMARLPDNDQGRELMAQLQGLASEIWSTTPLPIQYASILAFQEPPELLERIANSRRLHARVASAVAECFMAVGATLTAPQGAFYLYPDLEVWRERLDAKHSITTGPELASYLLHEYGLGILPGSDFGESPTALRFRVATSLLYGDTDEHREAALMATNPLVLPWIQDALNQLEQTLADIAEA